MKCKYFFLYYWMIAIPMATVMLFHCITIPSNSAHFHRLNFTTRPAPGVTFSAAKNRVTLSGRIASRDRPLWRRQKTFSSTRSGIKPSIAKQTNSCIKFCSNTTTICPEGFCGMSIRVVHSNKCEFQKHLFWKK